MFFKTRALKIFATFTEKHLCWSLILIKLLCVMPATKDTHRKNTPSNKTEELTKSMNINLYIK